MSSAADATTTQTTNGEPVLSKAELRRRRILAKKGARMALVTGDSALAAADTTPAPVVASESAPIIAPRATDEERPLMTEVEPVDVPTPAPAPALAPVPVMPTMPELPGMRGWKMPLFPDNVRTGMIIVGGLSMPFVRRYLWERLSAVQLFLAIEAIILAPEIASWSDSGMLATAIGIAKQSSMVWRDISVYLLSLFIVLRYF